MFLNDESLILLMDSFEKMRRMKEVSKDLKKFQFATSSDDAVRQAEQMMMDGKRGKGDIFVTSDEIHGDIKITEGEHPHVRGETMADSNVLAQMERQLQAVQGEIQVIKDKMNEMIVIINELETKAKAQPRQEMQQRQPEQQKLSEQQRQPEQQKTEPHARSGQYKPGDVAIDKIFYMGQK